MKIFSPLFAVAIAAAVYAPRVNANSCFTTCTGGNCKPLNIAANAQPVPVVAAAPTVACATGKYQYLSALKVCANGGDVVDVTFTDTGVTTPASASVVTDADTDGNGNVCSKTYKSVGKFDNLAKDVTFTAQCHDGTKACALSYDATWACQPPTTMCAKECDDFKTCQESPIAASGSLELKPPVGTCPATSKAYLKSLNVGARDKTPVTVEFYRDASTTLDSTPGTKDDSSAGTTGDCYQHYSNYPVAQGDIDSLTADAKAVVKCTGGAACKVQAYPEWGCVGTSCANLCSTSGGSGSCTKTLIPAAGKVVIKKPAGVVCPSGTYAYPKNVVVGGDYTASKVAVGFNNNLTPTASLSTGTCFIKHTDPLSNYPQITSDVEATITCPGGAACTVQYKVGSWSCYAPPDVTKTYKRTAATGANCNLDTSTCANRCTKSYRVGKKDGMMTLVPQAAADCTGADVCPVLTGTPSADGKTATTSDTKTISFPSGKMSIDGTGASAVCQTTYALGNVTNPFVARSYMRQSTTPALCAGAATDCVSKCGLDITLTTPQTDKIVATQAVGDCQCSGVTTAFVNDLGTKATDSTTNIVYTPTTSGMTVVTSTTANSVTTTCTAVYAGRCAKQCSDPTACVSKDIDVGGNFIVTKPTDADACPAGTFAYPKTLVVGAKDLSQVAVTFNNGLTPNTTDASGTCYYKYENVVGTSAVTSDVQATVTCLDPAAACTALVNVGEWGCYGPPDATKTYTRSSAKGDGCPKLSDCASRCAKSYVLGKKDDQTVFVPQLAPDCNCDVIMATTAADGSATNSATSMNVLFDTAKNIMTVEYTGDNACLSTYTPVGFTNPFAAKTYTRQNVTPAECVKATDCGYRCAAEIAVSKIQADVMLATRTPVSNCTCTNSTVYVADDGVTAVGNDALGTYVVANTDTGIAVNTTLSAKTCRALYTEKVAPTPAPTPAPTAAPPAPVTTAPAPTAKTGAGTSAGVSALGPGAGAGVVSVTLVAAAAGVQAIGLPV